MTHYYTQSPQELLDYSLDWSAALGTETIVASGWSASGVTLSNETFTSTTTTFWVTGGVAGSGYEILNTVTTSGGRTYQDSVTITMISK